MTNDQIESSATDHASKYPEHLRTDIVLHYGLGIVRGLKEGREELAAKDKEIETLTKQIKAYKTLQKTGDEIRAHQSKLLSEAKTVESEREANVILTDEIERRDKEIERLTKIIFDFRISRPS